MKALITGGIGDFIATESHFSDHIRNNITEFKLGCFHNREIEELIRASNVYPKLDRISYFFQDFPKNIKRYFKNATQRIEAAIKVELKNDVLDYSLTNSFKKIRLKESLFNRSSLLTRSLCNIQRFKLPDRYCFISPYSLKAMPARQYSEQDWANTLAILRQQDLAGVVVTEDDSFVPTTDNLITLKKETTILEAIEILKNAKGFIGIDSFPSILAAQLDLQIYKVKCVNQNTYSWKKHIYFAPRDCFSFLNTTITSDIKVRLL